MKHVRIDLAFLQTFAEKAELESLQAQGAGILSRKKTTSKRDAAELMEKPPGGTPSRKLKVDYYGWLNISYANGDSQKVKLHGVVLRPLVVASPPMYSFGECHVEQDKKCLIYLSNPTAVTARWKITQVTAPVT